MAEGATAEVRRQVEELGRRYVDLVYQAAVRQMGGEGRGAEDVTQAVFLLVMRKAKTGALPEEGRMAGWLQNVTRYAVKEARRRDSARQRHEENVAAGRGEAAEPEADATEVRRVLDQALSKLGAIDREVVVRRYLRGEAVGEVAIAVGLAENTVSRRIGRALEKLRNILVRKGVIVPAAGLAGVMIAESAKAAPAGLLASVVGVSGGSVAAVGIAKGAAVMMKVGMLKVAAAVLCLVAIPVAVGVTIMAAQGNAPIAAKLASTGPANLPFALGKETTGITEPLNGDGTPNYLKALNDKYSKGVTPENNAFVAWLKVVGTGEQIVDGDVQQEVLAMCGAPASAGMAWQTYAGYLQQHGANIGEKQGQEGDAIRHLWTEKEYPMLAAYLEEQRTYLDDVEEAFARPRYWAPYVPADGRVLAWVEFPLLGRLRADAISLCDRATLRAKSGDFDGFLADVVAVKRIGRRVGSGATIFERQVGNLIDLPANDALGAVCGAGVLSAKQCGALEEALGALGPLPPMREAAEVCGRWMKLDEAILEATGQGYLLRNPEAAPPGQGGEARNVGWADVAETAELGVFDRDAVDWNRVLKRINQGCDKDIAALATAKFEDLEAAQWEVEKRIQQVGQPDARSFSRCADETPGQYTDRVADMILAAPLVPKMEGYYREYLMRDAMADALIAAAKYHAEKGQWPEKLEDLVPAYMKEVPKDVYRVGGNGAVQFAVSPGGARVYSIGRNRVDDHGVRDSATKRDDIVVGVQAN